MIEISAWPLRAPARLLGALSGFVMAGAPAFGQGALTAHYTITMTGVSVGQLDWMTEIGDTAYTAKASGKASGVLSVLVNGEGSVETKGAVADGRLTPSNFTSKIVDDEGNSDLQVTFADGVATERIVRGPPPTADRLPVSDDDRRGVSDPLSAMLVPAKAGGDVLSAENCRHLLPIFDGRRRYNLMLSFGRIDKYQSMRGYNGPVLVCAVVLRPISGYKPDSMLVKYVAGRRDMELWFAPIAGTAIMAPIRVVMPTLIGTLKIEAVQFETVAAKLAAPAPAPVETQPLPLPPPR